MTRSQKSESSLLTNHVETHEVEEVVTRIMRLCRFTKYCHAFTTHCPQFILSYIPQQKQSQFLLWMLFASFHLGARRKKNTWASHSGCNVIPDDTNCTVGRDLGEVGRHGHMCSGVAGKHPHKPSQWLYVSRPWKCSMPPTPQLRYENCTANAKGCATNAVDADVCDEFKVTQTAYYRQH